jgi:hypothetical protein
MTRRGRNEGSINKRADGRWEARLTLIDGKRKSYYGKTRKEVADKLRQALQDQAEGLPIVAEKITIGQHLEAWLKTSALRTDPSTHMRYENLVRLRLGPAFGSMLLARLDAPTVQRFYDTLGQTLSPATIRLTNAVLSQALSQAVKLGLLHAMCVIR